MSRGSDTAEQALAQLCRREHPRLVGLLALRVGDRRVAEELAQEALVRLCQRWPDVERPSAWLTRVSLNLSSSWLRRRMAERRAYRRHGPSPAAQPPPESADVIVVRRAVAALPDRQRTAVILRYYEQLTVAETATVMRCPEGTVKALTHRALRRLADGGLLVEEMADHG